MALVQLISREAARARAIEAAGHEVRMDEIEPGLFQKLAARLPDVIVIDLSRAPSTGRDIALAIRKRKAMRQVPFVFVEGDQKQLKTLLPNETYGVWANIDRAIAKALVPRHRPEAPSVFAGYAASPLPKKLGISPGDRVALVGEPEGFRATMPEDVRWQSRPTKQCNAAIWFVRTAAELDSELEWIARAGAPRLWIAWPKGGKARGLTQAEVRKAGMGIGMVDYKICSIDARWSALLFTWR